MPYRIIAADHPAVTDELEAFLTGLRSESRYFGPSARSNPKPFPSLIAQLAERAGLRLAAMDGNEVIGMVRVDARGEVAIAVAAAHRGRGVGTLLGRAALERAIELGYGRLVLRTTRRNRAVRGVGEALDCTVVDVGGGRTELLLDLAGDREIA